LLARQFAWVARAVDRVVDLLRGAAEQAAGPDGPTIPHESLWLRSAEACRDRHHPDAIAAVRRLQQTVLTGTTKRIADLYRCSAGLDQGIPAVRWWRARKGPVLKAYAKATDLLRVEVACPNREAVRALVPGSGTGDIDGAVAVDHLAAFARAAASLLAEGLEHVEAVLADRRSPAELVLDLLPLADLAAGRRLYERGMAPTRQARCEALRMLGSLLETGEAWATGLDGNGSVRRTLDALAQPGGPLSRAGRPAHYTLRPAPPRAETIR
jgi:hypothetical protein